MKLCIVSTTLVPFYLDLEVMINVKTQIKPVSRLFENRLGMGKDS